MTREAITTRAEWAAERRRTPTHAEMLARALRVALPYSSHLAHDDGRPLAQIMRDNHQTQGGTGPGRTMYDTTRRGVRFTYHAEELPESCREWKRAGTEDAATQAAAIDRWHESQVVLAEFSWEELAERIAPRAAVVEAARTLADARRSALVENVPYWQTATDAEREWSKMHEADRWHIDTRCRMLAELAISEADTAETLGGML